jgi:hypothetical protein
MTCEDIVPLTGLAVGVGANFNVDTHGYDWVAVLLIASTANTAFSIGVLPDSGGSFNIADGNIPAGNFTTVCFGGSGGLLRESLGPVSTLAGIPFVPNAIQIVIVATPGSAVTYAVVGGYLE